MFKKILNNALEWVLSGVIAVSIFAFTLVAISAGPGLAKEIYRLDLSRDDIYEAFSSVVVDMGTLKDAVDDLIGGVGADTTLLSTLANETSADLTTDSTAITALMNEIRTDFVTMNVVVGELIRDFNLEATAQWSWGNSITNTAPVPFGNTVVTPATRTAPVVTPAGVSNQTGTLTTTTPTL